MKATVNSSKFCLSNFHKCLIRQILSDFSTVKVLRYMVLFAQPASVIMEQYFVHKPYVNGTHTHKHACTYIYIQIVIIYIYIGQLITEEHLLMKHTSFHLMQ